MKRFYPFVLAGLLLASGAIHWTERSRVAALRQESERLREELAAAQRLIRAKEAGQSGPGNEELERLRTEAGGSPKLRDEVKQLRAGAEGPARLRTEKQQHPAADRPLP